VAHGRIGRKFSAEVGDPLPIAIAISFFPGGGGGAASRYRRTGGLAFAGLLGGWRGAKFVLRVDASDGSNPGVRFFVLLVLPVIKF
jgi:hypothetical protein